MKGKKGGESATSGVTFTTSAIPCTSKGNILAAAKRRKRGGAVAMKVEGDMPKIRLDKPKRARGGATDARSALKAIRDNMEVGGQKVYATGAKPKKDDIKRSTRAVIDDMKSKMQFASGGVVKDAEKAAGDMLSAAKNDSSAMPMRSMGSKTGPALKSKALRGDRSKPVQRASGGKIGDGEYDTPGQKIRDQVDDDNADADDRKRGGRVPKRARGGQIGADTKPMSHAAAKRPMRGHATQPNIT